MKVTHSNKHDSSRRCMLLNEIAGYLGTAALLMVATMTQAQSLDSLLSDAAVGSHGRTAHQPYGLANENVAGQLDQFAFVVGHFSRLERRRSPQTSDWSGWGRGEKTGSWIMDGRAILDEHINYDSGESVAFIRTYDAANSQWHNVRVSQPSFVLTDATGHFRDGQYFNTSRFTDAQDREVFQEYIFYDISNTGYKWRAQRTVEGQTFTYWEIEYVRKD